MLYVHNETLSSEKLSAKRRKDETFILHNAGDKDLKRPDYIADICQYKTKCIACKTMVQRVHSLIDEISDIKKSEVVGVCRHCNRANPAGKCRRCEYIVNKFLCNKVKMYEDRQARYKTWLNKVNKLLHNIMDKENACKHNIFNQSQSAELEKLLNELRSPLEMRQPEITLFPSVMGMSNWTQSMEMLEELLVMLKSGTLDRHSSDSLFVSTSTNCVCKYFKDKTKEGSSLVELLGNETSTKVTTETKPELKVQSGVPNDNVEIVASKGGTKEKVTPKEKSSKEKTTDSPEKSPKEKTTDLPEKFNKGKTPKSHKPKLSSEEAMLLKMMKNREKEKKNKEKSTKVEKAKVFAKIEPLPQLKVRKVIEIFEEKSESVVECNVVDTQANEMIKGIKLVNLDRNYKETTGPQTNAPILYQVETVFSEPVVKDISQRNLTTTTTTSSGDKLKKTKYTLPADTKGIIKYELSNREFIENGWTILPSTKIMRRLNVYKMEPSCPKYDWFERHKNRKDIFYETGEKLSEIDDNGRGKWFYKNGLVAMDYYNAQELNVGQRYVVYSDGEVSDAGKTKPVTVLASFDFLGNGVVYDNDRNVRLKYNQTEGIVVDKKIGTPGRWSWHSLNEPPVLQPVFMNTFDTERSSCMDNFLKSQKDDRSEASKEARPPNAEMLSIEFENFVKEKAHKLLQKFKPFKIRMKALKLNNQFSLKVLDQRNIYLLFREGRVSMKLNLGMSLISSEIVDSVTTDVSEVATPYDQYPPRSPSIAELQRTLVGAKKAAKARSADPKAVNKSNASNVSTSYS